MEEYLILLMSNSAGKGEHEIVVPPQTPKP